MRRYLCLLLLLFFAPCCSFYTYAQFIKTYAGTGTAGYSGDNGPAASATLKIPTCLSVDGFNNVYINDQGNNRIRKIRYPDGLITTVAGNGDTAYNGENIAATTAHLNQNWGVAVDGPGNIYITDQTNRRIRRVDAATGLIKTIAGDGVYAYTGDGGPAVSARLKRPLGIALDGDGNVYVGDPDTNTVRRIDAAGIITKFAGNGTYGFGGDGGPATAAKLSHMLGLAADGAGNVYICDADNNRVRKVNAAGIISTIAGNGTPASGGDGLQATAATINRPAGVFVSNTGEIYIAEYGGNRIRKINTAGVISTFAGTGTGGFSGDNGPATAAELRAPIAVAIDGNDRWFIADLLNVRIREVIKSLSFTAGHSQQLQVCQNAVKASINELLTVYEYATGFTDNWSLLMAPAHGTATAAYSVSSVSGSLTPTGLWYTPAAGYVGEDSFSVKVTNGAVSDITVIHVTIDPLTLTAGVITGDSELCAGTTVTLANAATGGTWGSTNNKTSVGTSSGIVTGVSAGADTILYTVTNACGTAVATRSITVNPLPQQGVISGATAVCIGNSITLIETEAGGIWSTDNGKSAINSSGVLTGIHKGISVVNYTVSNAWCMSAAVYTVMIDTLADAGVITGPESLCQGAIVLLGDTASSGVWSAGNDTAKVVAGRVTGMLPGTSVISYSVTNSCGAVVATHPVTVHPLPELPEINENLGLLSVPNIYTSYQWASGGVEIAGAVKNMIDADTSGIYTVAVGNSFGCTIAAQYDYIGCTAADVEVYPNPAAGILNISWCKRLTARLMTVDGKTVFLAGNVDKIDMAVLPNAVYLLSIFDANGNKIITKRIVKMTK